MNRRFVRFLISGGTAAIVEYATFLVLQLCLGKDWLLFNQPISFAAGFAVSFLLNRSWVFRSNGVVHSELMKYGTIAVINLAAGDLVIALLSGPFSMNQFVSKFLVMAMIATWNYFLFSKIVFKPRIGQA